MRELLWLMRARFGSGAAGVAINLPPRLDSVSPTTGTTAGGTTLTLSGNNFDGRPMTVTVGGVAATSVTRVSSTSATCVTPAGVAGAVDVVLSTPGGSATKAGGFSYLAAAPTVTSVSASSGTSVGGAPVTITGTNFTGATSVTFGGVAATSVVVVDATTITCNTPAGTPSASVTVAVTTPSGTGSLPSGYTYNALPTVSSVVNAISTSVGDIAGGYTVTITGTRLTGTSAVTFGGTAATSIVVVDSATVTCTVPAKAAGTYTVQITATDGTASLASAFEYWSPAQLSLVVWNRASYSGAPWSGTASAGSSGGNQLQDLAVTTPGTGTAVNGYTPIRFASGTGQRLYGPNSDTVFGVSTGSIVVLAKADTAGADAANTVSVRGLVAVQGAGEFQMGHSTAGLRVSVYDGAYQEVPSITQGTGAWFLAAARYNGSAVQARVNSGSFASNSTAAGNPVLSATATYLGASQAADTFDGDILEVLEGSLLLTDADVTKIRGYAATRYGVTV